MQLGRCAAAMPGAACSCQHQPPYTHILRLRSGGSGRAAAFEKRAQRGSSLFLCRERGLQGSQLCCCYRNLRRCHHCQQQGCCSPHAHGGVPGRACSPGGDGPRAKCIKCVVAPQAAAAAAGSSGGGSGRRPMGPGSGCYNAPWACSGHAHLFAVSSVQAGGLSGTRALAAQQVCLLVEHNHHSGRALEKAAEM